MRVKRILVPLDGSLLAESALEPAIALACEHDAELVLLRAAEARSLPMADPTVAQVNAVRTAEEYLAGVRARISRSGASRVETTVWYGAPAAVIVDAARFRQADLIVMSSHGRSGLGRLVLGSVAETVQRATHVPLLLIRPSSAPIDTPFMPARAKETVNV
jgi:nucleotide-binding universal stress UspA family protein